MSDTGQAKPLASLSLDLDDLWTYRKTRGLEDWQSLPTFLPVVVSRALDLLTELNLRITFFVVGQDADRRQNRPLLRAIADAGHEVANHSYHHEPWLHLYSEERLKRELADAASAIEDATGRKTVGFRGPGCSVTEPLRRLLVERGYEYDASANPNLLSPLSRTAYFRGVKLTPQQRVERRELNGSFLAAFGPNRAYLQPVGNRMLPVIPVSAMPLVRLPVHVSYLQLLNVGWPWLARGYATVAQRMFLLTRQSPSLLLHPTDLLGRDDGVDLMFFPAMQLPREQKLGLVRDVLRQVSGAFRIVTLREHAAALRRENTCVSPAVGPSSSTDY